MGESDNEEDTNSDGCRNVAWKHIGLPFLALLMAWPGTTATSAGSCGYLSATLRDHVILQYL
jgi:hypothetical protein